MNRIKLLFIILLSVKTLFLMGNESNLNNEILFISSYNTEGSFVQTNISAFVDSYIHLKGSLKPVVESLNCTSYDEQNKWLPSIKHILEKHTKAKAVVLIGNEAWMSYFSLKDEKYKTMPVFCIMGTKMNKELCSSDKPKNKGIKLIDIENIFKNYNVKFCYYYDYKINKDVELIKTLYPNTKNIAVITDNTYNGVVCKKNVCSFLKKNNPEFNIIKIDGTKLNLDEAFDRVKKLPHNTVAILCIWRFDKDGVLYLNNAEYAFKLANEKLPVFSLTGTSIGNWTIGGYIPKYRTIGNELAIQVNKVVDKNIDIKPIISGYGHQYKIDLNVLKQKNLLTTSLPKDVVFINAELSWKEIIVMYRWYFILAFFIIVILLISTIALISYNLHMRRLKNNIIEIDNQLRKEKETLIQSQKELIIAKEDAEEANKMKSTFVSNMSHEIRTPLNAILGFADVLVDSIEPTQEQVQILDIIKKNTDILLNLVNDILYLSRIEANRMEFKFTDYNIIPYIESTVISAGLSAKEGVVVKFDNNISEVILCTDIIRLQQIITNLIGNATKFTEKGSIILSIKFNDDKSKLFFYVTDTGNGIPLDQQKYIFDRFRKVNEFVQGTGLGLSICKLTVEKLGGEIWIDSSYTQGARFIFTIPVEHKEV